MLSHGRPPGHQRVIHVLRSGCQWQDCPACCGPPTTIYNRFHRWSAKGMWRRLFEAMLQTSDRDIHLIDSTTAKAQRSAAGGKGRPMLKQSVARAAADRQRSMLLSIVAAVQSRC
ncbi:transposase [Rhizobium sp. CFBP 8762]|uniref:transposase n=1 Tax=Rhizobium sp. CFBP 8762 TaxID=2775279 RepID=UPI00406C1102